MVYQKSFSRKKALVQKKNPTQISNKHLKDLLNTALTEIKTTQIIRPDQVLRAWNRIIDPNWTHMTEAISFEKGVVMINVKNTALYSFLVQVEQYKLLQRLRQECPHIEIKNIVFRIG